MRREKADISTSDADADGEDDRAAAQRAVMVAARHDRRAFAPVYEDYHQAIFGYCLRRLGDRDRAADAMAQTFARALASLHAYGRGSVAGWLFAIARNVVIDMTRTDRRHAALDDAHEVPDPARSPDALAVASEEERAVRAAIARLTPEQRAVVELRLAGLRGQEVADALGLSLAATKSLQHRAYARLRTLLRDDDPTGGVS